MKLLLAFALLLAACTPDEVQTFWASAGETTPLRPEVAVALADAMNTDCLAGYNADHRVECAIVDSWNAYPMPVSMAVWARVAWCESRLDPSAKNRYSSASGLYQQLSRYWPARARAAGFPGGDIFDARTNAFVSAHLASSSGIGHWNESRGCWG